MTVALVNKRNLLVVRKESPRGAYFNFGVRHRLPQEERRVAVAEVRVSEERARRKDGRWWQASGHDVRSLPLVFFSHY
jgi:hypothetical protein